MVHIGNPGSEQLPEVKASSPGLTSVAALEPRCSGSPPDSLIL